MAAADKIAGAENQGPDDKKGNPMETYYRVRNVLLTQDGTHLTLDPVEWVKGVDGTQDEDGTFEKWAEAGPNVEGAEPFEPGGKVTELRLGGSHNFKPDDFVTLDISRTQHSWNPDA